MGIEIKRMNWYQRRPVYETMQAWRAKHRAATERFESATAQAASAFSAAQTNLFAGLAEIATQAVIDRTQKELQAKSGGISLQV